MDDKDRQKQEDPCQQSFYLQAAFELRSEPELEQPQCHESSDGGSDPAAEMYRFCACDPQDLSIDDFIDHAPQFGDDHCENRQ